MYLFIANPTRQNQRIMYRLDFNMQGHPATQDGVLPKHQDIRPGQQAAIGGDLHGSQADSIIGQLRRYGLMEASEVDRLQGFVPYIYSRDKQIPASVIEKAIKHNLGVLSRDGEVRREQAAIAVANIAKSDNVTVGIEQVTESELGGTQIAEGFIVDKTAAIPDRKGGKGHRGSKLRAA